MAARLHGDLDCSTSGEMASLIPATRLSAVLSDPRGRRYKLRFYAVRR